MRQPTLFDMAVHLQAHRLHLLLKIWTWMWLNASLRPFSRGHFPMLWTPSVCSLLGTHLCRGPTTAGQALAVPTSATPVCLVSRPLQPQGVHLP